MQVATNDIYISTRNSSGSEDDVSSISSRNSQQMTNNDIQDTEKIKKITEAQEKFNKNQN